ncbi:siderophore-interacting protein [Nocardioides alcanivorans]|uniref:siderophore-interacting protein n=1 Tax=Nocardioides alcanivorans TaxID=2897352 RepID=UPI001F27D9AF|nr:siderophore-interacting protein [Nocardioides alcanivorans]
MTQDRTNPGPLVRAHQTGGRGTVRIPYATQIRTTRLVSRTEVTPHMLRLTLAGPEIRVLHSYACDDHVGVVFPLDDGTRNDPTYNPERLMLDWVAPAPQMRKYTIRRHDPVAGELDLDIVVHPGGLASDWATAAQPGDEVVLAGPPGALAFPHTYGHYVFAIDTTALPALARWLDEAEWIEPRGVTVQVLVDHDHLAETAYPLCERPGVDVTWLSRAGGSRLADAVAELDLGDRDAADVFLFAAGEAGGIKPLRRWAKGLGVASLVTGYWKRGAVEVDHEDEGHADDEHDEHEE